MSLRDLVLPVLVVALCAGTTPTKAQETANDTDALRARAEKLGSGVPVLVKLKDGSRMEGTLLRVSGDTLSVQRKTRIAAPPTVLPLAGVESIEPRKPGMSAGKKVLMWGAVGAAAVLGLMALTWATMVS